MLTYYQCFVIFLYDETFILFIFEFFYFCIQFLFLLGLAYVVALIQKPFNIFIWLSRFFNMIGDFLTFPIFRIGGGFFLFLLRYGQQIIVLFLMLAERRRYIIIIHQISIEDIALSVFIHCPITCPVFLIRSIIRYARYIFIRDLFNNDNIFLFLIDILVIALIFLLFFHLFFWFLFYKKKFKIAFTFE